MSTTHVNYMTSYFVEIAMTIAGFFESVSLTISFEDDSLPDHYQDMFTHFRNEYEPSEDTVRECLIDSYQYETDHGLSQLKCNAMIQTNNDTTTICNY